MSWPPIPTLVRGAGGPIKVRVRVRPRGTDGEEVWGLWDDARRIITLDKSASRVHQWRVLFHELAHAALNDAGLENVLEQKAAETICDALATARVQEMRGELGIIDS